ncbi:MAG: DinB family protein [Alphaproteobacteria bacterium]|nr:DinB family protein [Alphaproteobacteria bacterium]
MKPHFVTFAGYNAWANRRLYEAAATLTDEEYRADRGAFFRSVHGTLNHLLVTDRIWMRRLTGSGDAPDRLDAIVFDRLADLREAREAEDRRIVVYVAGLSEADLASTITYRRATTAEVFEQVRGEALAHLYNHQTHHRGQAHAILSGLGKRPPELDLLVFQRLAEAGRS